MSDIDKRILDAISREKQAGLEEGGDLGLFSMVAASFRDRLKLISVAVIAAVFLFSVLLVWVAFQFFPSVDVGEKLNWLAIGLSLVMLIIGLRLAYFAMLMRLSIIREIKRLELQVALLAQKLQS